MRFQEYQDQSTDTSIYPGQGEIGGLIYTVLGLTNEAGEVAGKLKKVLRDNGGELTREATLGIEKELGDVLWYLANVAEELGVNLEDVARDNLEKLSSRKARGTLQGSGDNR